MKIADVAKKFDLSTDTLRYYERVGLLPNVQRARNGFRDYSESDCEWIYFIKCMRASGISIEALSKYIHLFFQGDATVKERRDILLQERKKLIQRLEEMKNTLDKLDHKIETYNEKCLRYEESLLRKNK